jgi:hypothetical protein
MKIDYRCWFNGEQSCDGKCDSPTKPTGPRFCGFECSVCECESCNQAGLK